MLQPRGLNGPFYTVGPRRPSQQGHAAGFDGDHCVNGGCSKHDGTPFPDKPPACERGCPSHSRRSTRRRNDRGEGHLSRLFEPFYTTKPDGLEMGLPICHTIIEAHGERLWATPNEPRGAVSQFTLPVGPID
jgi:Histidine kinase-, DNA gyrase B-, and HSP90-like ATPase